MLSILMKGYGFVLVGQFERDKRKGGCPGVTFFMTFGEVNDGYMKLVRTSNLRTGYRRVAETRGGRERADASRSRVRLLQSCNDVTGRIIRGSQRLCR